MCRRLQTNNEKRAVVGMRRGFPEIRLHVVIPIINVSWHGGTRVLMQAANHLVEQGYQVTILCSRGRFASPYRLDERVRVRHVGVRTPWKQADYAIFLALLPFVASRRAVFMATFFVTYYSVRFAAAIRGTGYLYFVQDIESKYRGPAGAILNALCNLTYGDRRIVAANMHLADRLSREFGRSCRLAQIGPGSVFYTRPAARSEERYDVIYFLRREQWKGLDRFKEALTVASGRFRFLCVSQDDGLLASIGSGAVTCKKPADDEELIDFLDSARVLFFTSHREGFALPPLEGMARGRPVVLFRCGGPDVYVRDEVNGFYVNDANEAVEAISLLLADRDLYLRVSNEARRTAAAFRLEVGLRDLTGYLLDADAPRGSRR